MANVLFLAHRLPFPPNKGDKVRSYHLLRHLAQNHRVYLGTFVDDADDLPHLPTVRAWCADVCAPVIHPRVARVASLRGLLTGEALTLSYYRNAELQAWVDRLLAAGTIDTVLLFSSAMAQYVPAPERATVLADIVDVDSAKWTDYAPAHRWPLSAIYAREGRRLLAHERRVVAQASHSFLATQKEVDLLTALAPETQGRVSELGNGVDAEHFAPAADRPSPFEADQTPIVFTGAMDYWPNVDAVTWFVQDMLPPLLAQHPSLRFHIVGRSPTPAVRALAGPAVHVTGTVADVRPYLQHASAVVAPLRLARGIQNKVLEAMAMARPVVAARTCVQVIDAEDGVHVQSAQTAADFVQTLLGWLANPERATAMGKAGRERVLAAYSWAGRLRALDAHLKAARAEKAAA